MHCCQVVESALTESHYTNFATHAKINNNGFLRLATLKFNFFQLLAIFISLLLL